MRGGTDRSYGVHVARLAGLPKKVLERADELLREYDHYKDALTVGGELPHGTAGAVPAGKEVSSSPAREEEAMGSLFANSLSQELLALDVMSMTPIEAMNALFRLQQEAKKEQGL